MNGIWSRWKSKKPQPAAAPEFEPVATMLTDIGCTRTTNQDSGRITLPADLERRRDRGVLVMVADGMGGHQAGELASQWAIEVVNRVYYGGSGEPSADLVRAFQDANQHIYRHSREEESLHGMGTTCTALLLRRDRAFTAHVGDSRLYLIRGGEIYLMTEDHSAVMELVKQGSLTLEEARHHADRNVIIRALGSRPQVQVETWNEPLLLRAGDQFLVCSDGLYERVEDEEMKNAVLSNPAPQACENLVEMAKQRGGYDNITVAIVRLKSRGPAGEAKAARDTRETEVQA
jgi:PPM family protein phosphatase